MNPDKFLNDLLIPFLLNLFSTTTAFFLGYFIIRNVFKPRVEISPKIVCGKDINGRDVYKIKVINRSRYREITSINVQVLVTYTNFHHGKPTTQSQKIAVFPSEKFIIYKYRKLRMNEIPSFSARFIIREDLRSLENRYDFLDFRIFYTDSLSGRKFIKMQRYVLNDKDLFIEGEFHQDDSFNCSNLNYSEEITTFAEN